MNLEQESYMRTRRLNLTGGGYGVKLERSCKDYRDVELNNDCIVYCDIPYKGTDCHSYGGFDHDAFYDWALRQTVPVYISEYSMPGDFVMIHSMQKRQLMSSASSGKLIAEGIWVPRRLAEELKDKCTYQVELDFT